MELKIDKNEMSEVTYHTPIFDLVENTNTGIIKIHAPNWVNVAVFNRSSGEWITVEEHRYGIDKDIQEFMSGTVEEGETFKAAALRELEEELGYGIENIVHIEQLYEEWVNPAFMDNKVAGFYIEVEGEPHEQHLDEGEFVKPKKSMFAPNLLYNGLIGSFTEMKLKSHGFLD